MKSRIRVRVRIHTRGRREIHRVAELKKMREDLSKAVDMTAWGGKVFTKDHLKRIAGKGIVPGTYGACLKAAIEAGGDVIGAYKKCQADFDIGSRYRDLWEVPTPRS